MGEDADSNKPDRQPGSATPEQRRRLTELGRIPLARHAELSYSEAAEWIKLDERRQERQAASRWLPAQPTKPTPESAPAQRRRPSAADILIEIARTADLFHDAGQDLFATVEVGAHFETYRLHSRSFKRWLVHEFAIQEHKVPSSQALSAAFQGIEAIAQYEGETRTVYLRVAPAVDGIWVDVGDDAWHVIHVGQDDWEVRDTAPVRFVRGKNASALPTPVRGGSIAELVPFLNAHALDDPHFVLAIAFLIGAFHPRGPYPVLDIYGEQGAGKTSAAVRLKSLCDPSTTPVRSLPKNEQDLAICARNSWVILFDNVSAIPNWLSDAFCRLSTGGGFATRTLYTDDEEFSFAQKRAQLITGIPPVVQQADLMDRAILTDWPVQQSPKTESALDDEFEKVAGRILGAVLDALVAAVHGHGQTAAAATTLPRMADFFAWVTAAEPKLPWAPGTFASVYASNRAKSVESIVAASAIAEALIALIAAEGGFDNTPTHLLEALGRYTTPPVDPGRRPPYGWPKRPSDLTVQLRRLVPSLRRLGVSVELDIRVGHSGTRHIRVSRLHGRTASAASAASAPPLTEADGADAADDVSSQSAGPLEPDPGDLFHGRSTAADRARARLGVEPTRPPTESRRAKREHVRSGTTRSRTDRASGEVVTEVFDSTDGSWHRVIREPR